MLKPQTDWKPVIYGDLGTALGLRTERDRAPVARAAFDNTVRSIAISIGTDAPHLKEAAGLPASVLSPAMAPVANARAANNTAARPATAPKRGGPGSQLNA